MLILPIDGSVSSSCDLSCDWPIPQPIRIAAGAFLSAFFQHDHAYLLFIDFLLKKTYFFRPGIAFRDEHRHRP